MKTCILDQNPALEDQLAELLADGAKRKDIANVFQVDPSTITEWTKRATVQQKWSKLTERRSNRVLAKADAKIIAQLDADKDIPLETLLRVRQTFTPKDVNVNLGASPEKAMEELFQQIDADPKLAAALFGAAQAADEAADVGAD